MGMQLEALVVDLVERERSRFYGKYRGLVSDNADPEGIGRLRAQVPAVLGQQTSPWALPCAPYAGPNEGSFRIPPVGAAVWIEFEGGDPETPIWTGGWWAVGDTPTDDRGNAAGPPLKILRSETGLQLAFDDNGHTATLSDENGSNLLRISVDSGELRVQSTAKVIVEAPQIELVDGAPHPLVFGDDLLQYLNQLVQAFNTHMHPGETVLGIPVTPSIAVPPFPPATPVLLSTRVKTG
jgi:hypothetical protein